MHPGRLRSLLIFVLITVVAAHALPGVGRAQTRNDPTRPAPPELSLPRLAQGAVIDGRLDDPAWAQAVRMPIPARIGQFDVAPSDLAADIALFWNDQGLYLGVKVTDDRLVVAGERDPLAEYDSVEVWLQNLWVQVGPADSGARVRIRQLAGFPSMEFRYEAAIERGPAGYDVELFIPRSLWEMVLAEEMAPGAAFPLAFGVRDRDGDEPAEWKLHFPVWFGWNNVESMARAVLDEAP